MSDQKKKKKLIMSRCNEIRMVKTQHLNSYFSNAKFNIFSDFLKNLTPVNVTKLFIFYQGVPSLNLQKQSQENLLCSKGNMHYILCNLKICNICYICCLFILHRYLRKTRALLSTDITRIVRRIYFLLIFCC